MSEAVGAVKATSGASLLTEAPVGNAIRTGGGSAPACGASTNAAHHPSRFGPSRGFLPLITLPVSGSMSA
jgi:hypothetical protein